MNDDLERLSQGEPFDPFSVVLFKALQALSTLFFIAIALVAPLADKGKAGGKAEFLITMDWPDGHPDDIDLFVQDPLGNVVWYRRREAGFMTLERDNRGDANNSLVVNGQKTRSLTRQEMVSLRGVVAGEFTVNVYRFTALTGRPAPVTVTVEKLNPSVKMIAKETVDLNQSGEEKTAVRFVLDGQGDVVGVSRAGRSILQSFYNSSRNGGPL